MDERLKAFLLMAFMFAASVGASGLRAHRVGPPSSERVAYEEILPRQFGDWEEIPGQPVVIADPRQQREISLIYGQVVNRSYRERHSGEIIMVLLAYGEDQTKRNQVHRPEVCYPAQGFSISQQQSDEIAAGNRKIPVSRLVATLGARREQITYWIRIGDEVVQGGLEQRLAIIRAGLKGTVSDGLLFRISSLERSNQVDAELHGRFVSEMLNALPSQHHALFIGKGAS